jgi:hypothetical protein
MMRLACRTLAAIAVGAVALFASRRAECAGCCGTGYGLGQRLADGEDAALTASLRGYTLAGSWDDSRRYRSLDASSAQRELRSDFVVLVRASRRLQLGLFAAGVFSEREARDERTTGGGLGDVGALARLDVVTMRSHPVLPGLALTLNVLAPTGRSAWRSNDPLGSDVTGLGAWELRPGIALENWWSRWYGAITASVGLRLPITDESGDDVELAPRPQLLAVFGRSFDGGFSLTSGVDVEWEGAARVNGASTGDARSRTSFVAIGALDLTQRFTLMAAAQYEPPIDGLGANDLAGVAVTAGVRYAWHAGD